MQGEDRENDQHDCDAVRETAEVEQFEPVYSQEQCAKHDCRQIAAHGLHPPMILVSLMQQLHRRY